MTRKLWAYVFAVLSTYILAVILVSQFNIAKVVEMGFPVSFDQRLFAVMQDMVGLAGSYLPLIAIGFLLAFMFTALILLRFFHNPGVLFPLAGFVAIIAIHLLIDLMLGLTIVAPTRSLLGLLSQGLAGMLGGYVYMRAVRVMTEASSDDK